MLTISRCRWYVLTDVCAAGREGLVHPRVPLQHRREHFLHAFLLLPRSEYTFDSVGSTDTVYENSFIMAVYENFFLKFRQNFLSKGRLKNFFSRATIIKLFLYQSEWRALHIPYTHKFYGLKQRPTGFIHFLTAKISWCELCHFTSFTLTPGRSLTKNSLIIVVCAVFSIDNHYKTICRPFRTGYFSCRV